MACLYRDRVSVRRHMVPGRPLSTRRTPTVTYVVTRAPRDPKTPIAPPVDPDGELWTYGMFLPGFHLLAWAHAGPGLVAALLDDPDYATRSEQDQLVARIRRALGLQVVTQARINASAMLTDEWDGLCEWERHVLNGPRH